jgi:hypothetical protein
LKSLKSNKKYCSNECSLKNRGGYREGSGNSNSGYYNGIFCNSTYELVYVIYNIDNNIQFERFSGLLEKDGIKYIPDFIIDNTIIEIKGFHTEQVDKKTKVAQCFGYDVKILYRDDLAYAFEWVTENYEFKRLEELYDGYKPKFEYVCSHCNEIFYRDKKKDFKFCSRYCAGKGHIGRKKVHRS